MQDDDDFRRDLRGIARNNFSGSARPSDFMSQQDRQRATAIADAERRTAVVRSKVRDHFQNMKSQWVDSERARLARENPDKPRLALSEGPSPFGRLSNRKESRRDALTAQAEANVKARCDERLRRLDRIEHRLTRDAGRNRSRNRER